MEDCINWDSSLRQAMGILAEECGELIVAISKCKRFGFDSKYNGNIETNTSNLVKECGDILALIAILIRMGIISEDQVTEAKYHKLGKLKKYSTIEEKYLVRS